MNQKNYFIKIVQKDNMFHFQLWYIAKQEMGNSKGYATYSECIKGIQQFKDFIQKNEINDEGKYVKIEKLGERKFVYIFHNEDDEILYTSRIIETKYNCKKSIKSTCKNIINANIK